MSIPLTIALRIVAAVLIIAVALQHSLYNELLVKTIVIAHVLFILSLFSERHTQRIAVISLGLAIVVPIGAWRMFEAGSATQGFFILNVLIFLLIAYAAFRALANK